MAGKIKHPDQFIQASIDGFSEVIDIICVTNTCEYRKEDLHLVIS